MNTKHAAPFPALAPTELNYIHRVLVSFTKQAEPPANDGTLSDTAQLITLTASMLHHPAAGGNLRHLRASCLHLAGNHRKEQDILEATSLAIAAMEGQPDGYTTFLRFVKDRGLAPAIAAARL